MAGQTWERVPIDAQSVEAPLSQAAVFLIVTVNEGAKALDAVRGTIAGIDDIIKTVGFRDLAGRLSCVVGIGHDLWRRFSTGSMPAELHPFKPFDGKVHHAPATPGDVLFHIRAERFDLCFEFEKLLLHELGSSIRVVDAVRGFRYFDARDLLGFVDGTANPAGSDIPEAALVGDEDRDFAGGSYVVVQKYLHDLGAWNGIGPDRQQTIIGRTKADNIELPDASGKSQKSHKTLSTIVDDKGVEHDILRDNMPFGDPAQGEFGTYFIGYSRHLWVTEKMLERMFVGDPPGRHDRLLDFSTAKTGVTFFAPSRRVLTGLCGG